MKGADVSPPRRQRFGRDLAPRQGRTRFAAATIVNRQPEYLPEVGIFLILFLTSVQWTGLGQLLTAIWLALFALMVLLYRDNALSSLLRWWPLLLTPLIAVASTIWSDLPAVSARYGFQFLITAFVGVFFARLVSAERMLLTIFFSMTVFCLASVVVGRQGEAAVGTALIGLTGQKNQLGNIASWLLTTAVAVLFLPGRRVLRLVAVLSCILSVYILFATKAATAVINGALGAALVVGLVLMRRLPPSARIAALVGALLVLAPLAIIRPEIEEAIDYVTVDVFQKDPGLTGRTYLWDYADHLISRRPLLGYGYQAFWLGNGPDTRALMGWAGQSDGRSFNFHNTFRQIAVDTGLVGAAIFVGTLLVAALAGLRRILWAPTVPTCAFTAIFLMFVSRAGVDVIIGPFSLVPIVLYCCFFYMCWQAPKPAPDRFPKSVTRFSDEKRSKMMT